MKYTAFINRESHREFQIVLGGSFMAKMPVHGQKYTVIDSMNILWKFYPDTSEGYTQVVNTDHAFSPVFYFRFSEEGIPVTVTQYKHEI